MILGVLWAIWHAPGYLGGWMTVVFPSLVVYCVGYSIFATWLYNNTRGSILLMILLHSSSNAAISIGAKVLPTNLPPDMNTFVFIGWIPAITGVVLAILAMIVTRGSLSYKKTQ
jgi:hypothetical protein